MRSMGEIKLTLRRFYVHDSSGTADLDVAGSLAHVALQPVLGLLPERRSGTRRCCRPGIASRWPVMTELTSSVFAGHRICDLPKWWERVSSHHLFFHLSFWIHRIV